MKDETRKKRVALLKVMTEGLLKTMTEETPDDAPPPGALAAHAAELVANLTPAERKVLAERFRINKDTT